MRRAQYVEHEAFVRVARGFLGYLCLLILFGSVILIVHASMEIKKVRYRLTDANTQKMALLDEIRKLDNHIAELEQYNRVADLIHQNLPYLGPPRHPAIEIEVPGLQARSGVPEIPPELLEDHSPIARLRDGWNFMVGKVRVWMHKLIE